MTEKRLRPPHECMSRDVDELLTDGAGTLNDYQRGLTEGLEMAAKCVEEFLGGRNPMADAIRLLADAALQETGQ